MEQDIPIQFLWGTFCRKAIVDKATGSASVIEIVNGLQTTLKLPNNRENLSDSFPNVLVQLGELSTIAVFEKKIEFAKETNINLRAEIIFPGVEIPIVDIPVFIGTNQAHNHAIFNMANPYISVTPNDSISIYRGQVIYRFNEIEIAKISVSIVLDVVFEGES